MEKKDGYFDRFEQIRKLLYKNADLLRNDRAVYEIKDGLIGTCDIRDSDCPHLPAFHERVATEVMNTVGLADFSVETRINLNGFDSRGWHIFVHRLYIYPPGVAAVSIQDQVA